MSIRGGALKPCCARWLRGLWFLVFLVLDFLCCTCSMCTCRQLARALADASSEEGYSRRLLGDARAWGSKNDAANDTEHQRKLHAGDASTSSTAATAAMAHAVDEFPGLSLPTTSLGDTYGAHGGRGVLTETSQPQPDEALLCSL